MSASYPTLVDKVADLSKWYADCIDDDELELWPDFFVHQCEYKIVARENVEEGLPAAIMYCDSRGALIDRVVALRRANIYPSHYTRHIIGRPTILKIEQGVIRSQTSYAVFQTRQDGESVVYNVGKYLDEIIEENGQLRYRSKICIYDTHLIRTLMVTPI